MYNRFLHFDLYFLIPVVIAKSFVSTAELIVTAEIPRKEAKADIKTHPVTTYVKVSVQHNF